MLPPTSTITRRAHAKINLILSVGAAQPPKGYHPIISWMAPITLADELTLTRLPDSAGSEYHIEPADATRPIDWSIDQDLAVRAHRLMEKHAARPLPVSMRLLKRIPAGGGLGGGSSDAAAMLHGLNSLFDLQLATPVLGTLAGVLGSDIPFFIDDVGDSPRPAIVSGLGDRIERVPFVPAQLLLIIPPFGCPTGAVYKAFDDPGAARPGLREAQVRQILAAAVSAHRINPAQLFNDLAAPAQAVQPRLSPIRIAAREALGTPVHITGSGSTMFAILQDAGPETAERMASDLRTRLRGCNVVASSLC